MAKRLLISRRVFIISSITKKLEQTTCPAGRTIPIVGEKYNRETCPTSTHAYAKANLPECVSTITTEKLNAQDYTTLALEKLDRGGELLPGMDSTPAHEAVKITFGR